MYRYSFLLFLLLFKSITDAGSVTGAVRNAQTAKVIVDATVIVPEAEDTTKTDSSGVYFVDSLEPGTYSLHIYKDGFEPQIRNDVYIAGLGKKRVDIDLVPQIYTLDKMVVRSKSFHRSPDMSSSTKIMNADEILRAPGALVDVQRVVQNLPSVTSGGDNINEVVVRGGMPGENLLIMDNIEIPNANHFADQKSGGGVISLINPLLVKGLTFNAGAPPAQYGGKASSVIDVTLRDGNDVIVLGGLDLGMAGAGGHIEGPMWKGSNFMASFHKSYLDFIASFDPATPIPKFWGLQSKVSQKIGTHKLSANGIYGKNEITLKDLKNEQDMNYDQIESGGIVYAAGLNWNSQWTDNFSTLFLFSGTGNTFDRFTYTLPHDTFPLDTFFLGKSWTDEQTMKLRGAFNLPNNNRILAGTYLKRCEFSVDQNEKPDTLKDYTNAPVNGVVVVDSISGKPIVYREFANVKEAAYKYGGFTSLTLHAFDRFRLVPGIRFDGFNYNESFTISPRISMILSLSENLDLTSAFGFQYQEPEYVDLGIDPRNKNLDPKQVMTGILGFEYFLDNIDTKIITEGFYKQYNNLLFDASLLTPDPFDESDRLVDNGEGFSFGLELFAQKKLTKSFFWTAAFALSKSQYKDLRPGHEDEWYDGDYDFRRSFTVTGGWKKELIKSKKYKENFHDKLWFKILSPIMPIADRIELSTKWRYLSGRPYTKRKFDNITYKRWYIDPNGPLNGERHEPYHRLDIRFERRYGFGFLQMIYYIDLQNIYNRENIWTYLYPEYDRTNPNQTIERKAIRQFPFFPAGGIIIGF